MKKLFVIITLLNVLNCYAQPSTLSENTMQNNMPYALIAGGSKGIGYAIAEALAKRKYNLILIARHADSLIAARNKLESTYNIHVELLQNDLSREEAAIEIAKWCTDNNIPLKVLCNVAV